MGEGHPTGEPPKKHQKKKEKQIFSGGGNLRGRSLTRGALKK